MVFGMKNPKDGEEAKSQSTSPQPIKRKRPGPASKTMKRRKTAIGGESKERSLSHEEGAVKKLSKKVENDNCFLCFRPATPSQWVEEEEEEEEGEKCKFVQNLLQQALMLEDAEMENFPSPMAAFCESCEINVRYLWGVEEILRKAARKKARKIADVRKAVLRGEERRMEMEAASGIGMNMTNPLMKARMLIVQRLNDKEKLETNQRSDEADAVNEVDKDVKKENHDVTTAEDSEEISNKQEQQPMDTEEGVDVEEQAETTSPVEEYFDVETSLVFPHNAAERVEVEGNEQKTEVEEEDDGVEDADSSLVIDEDNIDMLEGRLVVKTEEPELKIAEDDNDSYVVILSDDDEAVAVDKQTTEQPSGLEDENAKGHSTYSVSSQDVVGEDEEESRKSVCDDDMLTDDSEGEKKAVVEDPSKPDSSSTDEFHDAVACEVTTAEDSEEDDVESDLKRAEERMQHKCKDDATNVRDDTTTKEKLEYYQVTDDDSVHDSEEEEKSGVSDVKGATEPGKLSTSQASETSEAAAESETGRKMAKKSSSPIEIRRPTGFNPNMSSSEVVPEVPSGTGPDKPKSEPSSSLAEPEGEPKIIKKKPCARKSTGGYYPIRFPLPPPPVSVVNTDEFPAGGTSSSSPLFPLELPENPKFMLSREKMSSLHQDIAEDIINDLGGSIIDKEDEFDPDAVALIADRLVSSEKVVCSIAAGIPILKMRYLEKSAKARRFIRVKQRHVWQEADVKPTEREERKLVRASYNWLIAQRQDGKKGVMFGKKFFLLPAPQSRMETSRRMIEAAGGELVDDREDATIIITDKAPSQKMKNRRIPIKNASALYSMIVSDPFK